MREEIQREVDETRERLRGKVESVGFDTVEPRFNEIVEEIVKLAIDHNEERIRVVGDFRNRVNQII